MKFIVPFVVASGLATLGMVPAPAVAAAADQGSTLVATPFAMSAAGFGTRVQVGEAPASLGTTAYHAIGCTNRGGIGHANGRESVQLTDQATATAVDTSLSTVKAEGAVTVTSRHSVAEIVIEDTVDGTLAIQGITSTATAWHDRSGFHGEAATAVAAVVLTPVDGPSVSLAVPGAGERLAVPGLATIILGTPSSGQSTQGAWSRTTGLVIKLPDTETRIELARSKARIAAGVKHGLFRGSSFALRAGAVSGGATTGRQPLSLTPCQGTGGTPRKKSMARMDLGDSVVVTELTSRQVSDQDRDTAWGRQRAAVSSVDVGDGALVIKSIVARARVIRSAEGVTADSRGTGIGEIWVAGKRVALPRSGTLTVPGVARVEAGLVTRGRGKISVTGVRLTLLDGSDAVVDLAQANLQIASSR